MRKYLKLLEDISPIIRFEIKPDRNSYKIYGCNRVHTVSYIKRNKKLSVNMYFYIDIKQLINLENNTTMRVVKNKNSYNLEFRDGVYELLLPNKMLYIYKYRLDKSIPLYTGSYQFELTFDQFKKLLNNANEAKFLYFHYYKDKKAILKSYGPSGTMNLSVDIKKTTNHLYPIHDFTVKCLIDDIPKIFNEEDEDDVKFLIHYKRIVIKNYLYITKINDFDYDLAKELELFDYYMIIAIINQRCINLYQFYNYYIP